MDNSIRHQASKKTTITRKTKNPGVRSIWDRSEKTNDYQLRKGGMKFQATVEFTDRPSITKSFRTIEEAVVWRMNQKCSAENEPLIPRMSFKELVDKFLDYRKSRVQPSTFSGYLNRLPNLSYFNDFEVSSIRSFDVDSWLKQAVYIASIKEKQRRISFKHEVKILKSIFTFYREYHFDRFISPVMLRHLRDDCIVNRPELERRKSEHNQHFLTDQDISLFVGHLKSRIAISGLDHMVFCMALIQLYTGLRIGEVAALTWQDLDLDSGKTIVSKTVQWSRRKGQESLIRNSTKSGTSRKVIFHTSLLFEMNGLRRGQNRITGLIFSENGIKPITHRAIQYRYNRAFEANGLRFRSTHILRHTFATQYSQKVSNAGALSRTMGHSTEQMTNVYRKTPNEAIEAGLNEFGNQLEKDLSKII